MTHAEAQALTAFAHYCTCGGYARHSIEPVQPHMSWCLQYPDHAEWYAALHSDHPVIVLAGDEREFRGWERHNADYRGRRCRYVGTVEQLMGLRGVDVVRIGTWYMRAVYHSDEFRQRLLMAERTA